jgi:hypothetical protein
MGSERKCATSGRVRSGPVDIANASRQSQGASHRVQIHVKHRPRVVMGGLQIAMGGK